MYVYDDPIRDQVLSGAGLYSSLRYPGLRYFVVFMDNWFMQLLFLVSGIGVVFSLGKRDWRSFVGERAYRLTLPLGIGTLTIVPIQAWLKAIDFGEWKGGFLAFYPRFLAGHYEWGHLWFLGYLFAFSLLALPLFLRWKSRGLPALLVSPLSKGRGLLWPALLFGALEAGLRPRWPGNYTLIDDWACFSVYLGFFVLGFLIGSDGSLLERAERLRFASLALGAGAFLARIGCGYILPASWGYNPGTMIAQFLRGAASWGLALAALGFGRRFMSGGRFFAGPAYALARDLSFPLYFFHFVLVTAATWLLLGTGLPAMLRWAISVLAAWGGSAALTWIIRLWGPSRSLFGLSRPR